MSRPRPTSIMRIAVITIGALMIVFGLLLQFRPDLAEGLLAPLRQPGIGPIMLGLVLLLSGVFQGRYRPLSATRGLEGDGWEETGETFRDEESGVWVRVWFNPTSGERRYLPTDPAR
jgi:hypothetical protein